MSKKSLGYTLAVIGIICILLSLPNIQTITKISLPENVSSSLIQIGGIILFLVGIIISYSKGSGSTKKHHEVPIYDKDNNVIGYKRH